MTAIWSSDETGTWRLMAPRGFPDEATLHTMVEQAPQMLPLAGAPQLAILGREVQLGSGYADLLAVEPSGRLAVIEVKLSRNAEARRAVVAQVLTYAAYLRGMDVETLEQQILRKHLRERSHASLVDAARSNDQAGAFDAAAFLESLSDSLARGRFRLVFVLDDAPEELVRLVGYLEAVTEGLLIDLITVSAYEVNQSQIIVPQRVDPEQQKPQQQRLQQRGQSGSSEAPALAASRQKGMLTPGAEGFIASIEDAAEADKPQLRMLVEWALALEKAGLSTLDTYHGVANRKTLLPRLVDEGKGLVTLWNERGGYIQFWRSVFERRAPGSIARIEELIAPASLGKGTTTRNITEELLSALTDAYREAVAASATLQKSGSGDAAV